MKARDIAAGILQMFPEECEAKKARARVDFTDYTLQDQLVAEVGSTWRKLVERHPHVKTVEKRPREFFYSELSDEEDADEVVEPKAEVRQTKILEHELYPILSEFARGELRCYTMRIDERRSSNTRGTRGNHWLFPDVVGLEDLTESWGPGMRKLAKVSAGRRAMLYSFEVKLKLNRSNVREHFFQTVSNSTWANYSYLVASEVRSDAMEELRLLSSAHGVGLIQLDVNEPTDSQILIPAALRSDVDWSLLSRLAGENPDAKEFVELTHDFLAIGRLRDKDWS